MNNIGQNNNEQNNNQTHLIKLHGANPNSASSFAKVSLNKKEIVDKYKWYLGKDGYPFAYINGGRAPLHRFIHYINTDNWNNAFYDELSCKIKKYYVDHVNRDKLDATDGNLRLATPAENSYNKTSTNTIIDPYTNKPLHHIKLKKSGYEVTINKDGNTNKISKIKTLEEAKEIYNMMATELFGNYAVLYD